MEYIFRDVVIKAGIVIDLFLKYLIFQLNIINLIKYKFKYIMISYLKRYIKNLNIIIYFFY